MAGKMKLTSEMLKSFCGEGDVIAWLSKINLIPRLKEIMDISCFIPLYLEGDTHTLHIEMTGRTA